MIVVTPHPYQRHALTGWVSDRLKVRFSSDAQAIGFREDRFLLAVIVYDNYRSDALGGDIEMSIASDSPRWASRATLRTAFSYPFDQLGCHRVTAVCGENDAKVRKFLTRLGFLHEGTIREGLDGQGAAVFGMLKRECKWIDHGQEIVSVSAACA